MYPMSCAYKCKQNVTTVQISACLVKFCVHISTLTDDYVIYIDIKCHTVYLKLSRYV